MAHFYHGNWRALHHHAPDDWSISTSHDPLPSSCHSEKMLWNPSIQNEAKSSVGSSLPAKSNNSMQDKCATPSQPAIPLGTITHPFRLMSAYPHSTNPPSTVTTYHKHAFETVDYIYFTPLSIPRSAQETSREGKGFRLLGRKILPARI